MGRKPSTNPHAILSISLPLTTRAKLDAFNPRNRSAFVNQAILNHIRENDPSRDSTDDARDVVNELTTAQIAAILNARLMNTEKKQLKAALIRVIMDPQFRG